MFRKQTIDRMSQLPRKLRISYQALRKRPGPLLNKDVNVLSPVCVEMMTDMELVVWYIMPGWSLTAWYTFHFVCVEVTCRYRDKYDGCGSQWVSSWLDKPVAGHRGDVGRSEWKRLRWEGWKMRERSFKRELSGCHTPTAALVLQPSLCAVISVSSKKPPSKCSPNSRVKSKAGDSWNLGGLLGGGADWLANWEGVSWKRYALHLKLLCTQVARGLFHKHYYFPFKKYCSMCSL